MNGSGDVSLRSAMSLGSIVAVAYIATWWSFRTVLMRCGPSRHRRCCCGHSESDREVNKSSPGKTLFQPVATPSIRPH